MAFDVLYEDNHLIVVNKHNNVLVQGDKTGDVPLVELVKTYIKETYQKPGNVFLGVIHRIDRPVSGIVIFAKTGKALERMNALFKEKQIKKFYWAIVEKKPQHQKETLCHLLSRNSKMNKSFVVHKKTADTREAILTYTFKSSSLKYHLLEIELETGRHHQIRVQLSHIGCIIKGDLKYGGKRSNQDGGISLHARSVQFTHPVTKQKVLVTAPTPADNLWKELTKNI